jgi:hypothetical protein
VLGLFSIKIMKNLVVLDIEIYPNYSLFAFKNIDNNKIVTIEIKGEDSFLSDQDLKKLKTILYKRTTFGFNSRNYDMPIILYALKQKTAYELYEMSKMIILNNIPGWKTIKDFYLLQSKDINHFDIQEPSPGAGVSLKLYGGRIHSKRLQDLPYDPNLELTKNQMDEIKSYCINDLDTTIDLYKSISDRIDLRLKMSEKYNVNLMSKSDAQIAEAIIKSEIKKINPNARLYAPKINKEATFKYKKPNFISFKTQELNDVLKYIENHNFELDARGSIKLPKKLRDLKINLGKSNYQLGVGGLHSTEKSQTLIPKKNQLLIDKDVASYYPSIILNLKLYPKNLGHVFLDVYKKIVEERLIAKKNNDKVTNESLKIVINGAFGKLGSKWSCLYSPDLMMTVTLTGQLALLMLIEELELNNISVVSANTDGFVSLLEKNDYEKYNDICKTWSRKTQFILEDNYYKALCARDVNNYFAITVENEIKEKGIFAKDSLQKNPQGSICARAVIELVKNKISITDTIKRCRDITKFIHVRRVTGGAEFHNKYLGKVVRWYYSKNGDKIVYSKNCKKSGDKVAKSNDAMPIMQLSAFPEDIAYDKYIEESISILEEIGYLNL